MYLWSDSTSLNFSSNASDIGGSFLLPTHYSYWKWCTCCWETINGDICTMELAATLVGLASGVGQHFTRLRLLWLTDSANSVINYNKGYGTSPEQTSVIAELRSISIEFQFELRLAWTKRENIKRTDSLTRLSNKSFIANDTRAFLTPKGGDALEVLFPPNIDLDMPAVLGFRRNHSHAKNYELNRKRKRV